MSREIRTYADALRYLYGLADYERNRPRARDAFHLSGIQALLRALGDPHLELRAVHIAGSKGKGSTAAMLTGALGAAGLRVGTYTSPHLNTHRERYLLGGQPVSEEQFTTLLMDVQPTIEQVRREQELTTYDVTTALAFELFRRERVDWSVVEVGLGGRLDATNVLLPALCVITPVSLDHTEVLGDTLEQIAREKGGIIKPGVPVVLAHQEPGPLAVLREQAQAAGSEVLEADRLALAEDRHLHETARQEFTLRTDLDVQGVPLDRCRVRLSLLGAHQVENALTAVVTFARLAHEDPRLSVTALLAGLERLRWPGRFELVVRGRTTFVLDGAHSPYSVRRLMEALREIFPDRRPHVVFATGRDHDERGMLEQLRSVELTLTRSSHPRALPASELAVVAASLGIAHRTAATVTEVVGRLAGAGEEPLVVVCGSLFAVADAREALGLAEATDPVRS